MNLVQEIALDRTSRAFRLSRMHEIDGLVRIFPKRFFLTWGFTTTDGENGRKIALDRNSRAPRGADMHEIDGLVRFPARDVRSSAICRIRVRGVARPLVPD